MCALTVAISASRDMASIVRYRTKLEQKEKVVVVQFGFPQDRQHAEGCETL
jgi:hypothetical protein